MTHAMQTLAKTVQVVERGIEEGLHLGAQFYVSLGGGVIANVAVGLDRPEGEGGTRALDTGDLSLWRSACKPAGAIAIAQLWEKGLVDLDEPIAERFPDFAQGGKERVTLRHILTHTGGIRDSGQLDIRLSWDELVARVCAIPLEPDWVPGETAGYHLRSSWYIVAETVRLVDGRPFPRYVREAIFEPLGMRDSWIGMTEEAFDRYGDRIARIYNTHKGKLQLLPAHARARCIPCRPGGNGRGPMAELGIFYEMLLSRGARGGVRIVEEETVAEFTRVHRRDKFDLTFRHKMDWGLGFIVDSKRHGLQTVPYGYGVHCSPRTYGHGGFQSSSGFADPEHELVVAVAFNGTPGEPKHGKRIRQFATAVYEDLGLAGR